MKRVMAKSVLQLLLSEQKEHRVAVANDLIQTATNESDYLKKVITRDEWWVYHSYYWDTKAQSSQLESTGSPCPQKARQSHSKIKTMLTLFFDWEDIVHHKYTPPGHTI